MKTAILVFYALLSFTGCSQLNEFVGKKNSAKTFSIDKLWVRNTLQKEFYGFRHSHRMSPIIFKGMIIQGNAIDGIGAYNQKSGHIKWFKKIKGGVEAGAVLANNKLYAGASDGFFYSLDAYTGQVIWKTPVKAETLSVPTFHNGFVYFIAGNNRVYSLDAKNGKVQWSYSRQETSALSIRGGSQPTVYKGALYLGFSDGVLVSLNLADGKLKWEKALNKNKRFRDIDAKATIVDGKIYIASFDQGLTCLDAEKGSIYWQHDQGGYSAATVYGDQIYYTSTDGNVISLDKDSGKLAWRYPLASGLGTQPVVYRGLLVFGEYEGDVVALDAGTGRVVGKYSPGRGVMSKPTVEKTSGKVYFISVNANLFAMKLQWKKPKDSWPWDKAL